MSFLSRALSTETLGRGLDIVRSQTMTATNDPEAEAMMAELARLEESHWAMGGHVCSHNTSHLIT